VKNIVNSIVLVSSENLYATGFLKFEDPSPLGEQ